MDQSAVVRTGARWHGRSPLSKMFIVGLVVASASLLPAAGSFVPRDSGNTIFGDVAEAACKWDGKPGPGGLKNYASRWWAWAQVKTNWCYSGGHVTSRHSVTSGDITSEGEKYRFYSYKPWAVTSQCNTYNGYWNHNCLTRFQFSWYSWYFGETTLCIHTRIYGDGSHSRQITDGYCPGGNLARW